MMYRFLFKFICGLIYTLFGLWYLKNSEFIDQRLIIPYVASFTIIGYIIGGDIWNKFFYKNEFIEYMYQAHKKGCDVTTPYSGICIRGTKGCNIIH